MDARSEFGIKNRMPCLSPTAQIISNCGFVLDFIGGPAGNNPCNRIAPGGGRSFWLQFHPNNTFGCLLPSQLWKSKRTESVFSRNKSGDPLSGRVEESIPVQDFHFGISILSFHGFNESSAPEEEVQLSSNCFSFFHWFFDCIHPTISWLREVTIQFEFLSFKIYFVALHMKCQHGLGWKKNYSSETAATAEWLSSSRVVTRAKS